MIYVGISFYFMNHFYFRSTINGIDIGGKSVASAKETIQKKMDAYQLLNIERDGTQETIVGNEIALEYKWNNEIDIFLESQNGYEWFLKLFKPNDHNSIFEVSFHEGQLENRLSTLSCMEEKKQIPPQNAAISNYSEKDGYTLIPSVAGSLINDEVFCEYI